MADAPTVIATIREAAQRFADTGSLQRFHDDISGVFLSVIDRNRDAVLRSAGITVDPKPGTINHLAPGIPHRSEPEHITSVTVALGATLSLAISGHSEDSRTATITLKAEGGTAIGVPTVAVDQLRDAGLVL